MTTETKKPGRAVLLWGLATLALLLIALLAVMIVLSGKAPASDPAQTTDTSQNTQAATQILELPTETTEPLIPINPYGPEDFGIEGHYMACLAGESLVGIDVSTWQGYIDWEQVRDSGIEFAIIRIGYRGTEQGTLAEDDMAQTNYAGAKAAGLKVGAYFFSQAITPEEARDEAIYAMQIIKDWELDLSLVYDWEYVSEDARTANVDARLLTDCTVAFCREVEKNGYQSMIYFNPTQAHKQMFLEELTDYRFWLAMYDTVMTYPHKVDMWQYTNRGYVPGINGNVDVNLWFLYE